jgi:NCAIR mutase (PurE)-related protein
MDQRFVQQLLEQVRDGMLGTDDALEQLKDLPYEDLGCATVDHHRALRQGVAEVIFGQGKTVEQITRITTALLAKCGNVLVTRLDAVKARDLVEKFPQSQYHVDANCLTIEQQPAVDCGRGTILVVAAGTSDIPVAAEAALTARFLGNRVETIYDVGVAGIHRLLARREQLQQAAVLIVVAGMEGALPSVVGGLVARPVIAVPTSVGYGASFGGIAALLGMLNSCAAGVTVVNIDNGFGAGFAASLMNKS